VTGDLPVGFEIVMAAVFGAIIGSFLNVCILRWGAEPKQSVVTPRSRCPRCGQRLAWYDNIPVVSWILLRARCRGCGQPISAQYPLIELATAGIWAYMAWRYGVSLETVRGGTFATILLGIAMTDARGYIIPHEFSIGGTVIALLLSAWYDPSSALLSLQGALVGAGAVMLVGELSELAVGQEAMGGGDCALMGMVGAFLGWEAILPVLVIGAMISSLIFLLTAVWSRRSSPLVSATESAADDRAPPRFRWTLLARLLVVGAVPILLLAGAIGLGLAGDMFDAVFHGLIGAGLGYYASFIIPERIADQAWLRVRGLLAAALAVAFGAGLDPIRIAVGLILAGAVLWYVRRVSLTPSPQTTQALQSQGYLPFGVGLAAAAALLQFSEAMPMVRDIFAEYGWFLRLA
jgi:leader peptidase (prepilin peptidase) / N-methyltransferase